MYDEIQYYYMATMPGTRLLIITLGSEQNTSKGTLLPWNASYLGGNWSNITQCMIGGNDSWTTQHVVFNNGANDQWALKNSPYSMAYFTRDDIPTHFGVAEAWTVGDMYQESILSSIDSNRVFWFSGSAGIPGGPQKPDSGGPVIQNTDHRPGCHHTLPNSDCWPLNWHPIMTHLQEAGVTWQVYQDNPNIHGQDILSGFQDFNATKPGDPLYDRGLARNDSNTLLTFYKQAVNGTLPQVSWIISDHSLSEGSGYRPQDGAWQQTAVVAAVCVGNSTNSTALFVTYDNAGGWFDHVPPTHSLNGTAGEWMEDPYGEFGYTAAGPGFRLPFYIISPWTRGGNVFTEHADHSSQIMFLEQWLQAIGHNVTTGEIDSWRRQYMSNLVNAFDFDHPDYSIPNPPLPPSPPKNLTGFCSTQYPDNLTSIPYNQVRSDALTVEQGFKQVRGNLTEGRYLVFERNGFALSNTGQGFISITPATPKHETPMQEWVLQQYEAFGTSFKFYSVTDKRYIDTVDIVYLGNSEGYSLFSDGIYWDIDTNGNFQLSPTPAGFHVFSVSYGNRAWT
ncbi:hypothetical protein EG329_002547 [Mollisiaceae sp. DMI_Dod_QoI]|nr:hypothetical protein EG329_002547 [Helotiales sp. DMI_Dod_QoI]